MCENASEVIRKWNVNYDEIWNVNFVEICFFFGWYAEVLFVERRVRRFVMIVFFYLNLSVFRLGAINNCEKR